MLKVIIGKYLGVGGYVGEWAMCYTVRGGEGCCVLPERRTTTHINAKGAQPDVEIIRSYIIVKNSVLQNG